MRPSIINEEERCVENQHAQDLKYYCGSDQQATVIEGGIGIHLGRSRKAKTLSGTWLYSTSSAYQINLNNIPSVLYAWRPGYYTTLSSMQTRIRPITWSDFSMHRMSTRHAKESSYQGDYKNMEWKYFTHYMPLVFTLCCKIIRRRRKQ